MYMQWGCQEACKGTAYEKTYFCIKTQKQLKTTKHVGSCFLFKFKIRPIFSFASFHDTVPLFCVSAVQNMTIMYKRTLKRLRRNYAALTP